MSEYKSFDFEKVADALKAVREQYVAGADPFNNELVWTGPDRLHFHIAAITPEPAWHFSAEGMADHAENGRDFWDVYTMVAFQIGFHNGVVRMEPDVEMARRNAESAHHLIDILGAQS